MRKYSYEARDKSNNETVKSMVQAESETAAAKLLIEQGLMPLKLKELNDENSFLGKITDRITTKDKIVFLRQLSTLIGAGLPLAQSLHTVIEQTNNKKMQRIVEEVIGEVAPSPRAQNERPMVLSQRSSNFSRSASVPVPFSRSRRICTNHQVPSRHGVHLPHDSSL